MPNVSHQKIRFDNTNPGCTLSTVPPANFEHCVEQVVCAMTAEKSASKFRLRVHWEGRTYNVDLLPWLRELAPSAKRYALVPTSRKHATWMEVPSAREVSQTLNRLRKDSLKQIAETVEAGNIADFEREFENLRSGGRQDLSINQLQERMIEMCAGYIYTVDHIRLYLALKHGLQPKHNIGWVRGLLVEQELFRCALRERSQWQQLARDFFDMFPLEIPADIDIGDLVLSGTGEGEREQGSDPAPEQGRGNNEDIQRLLFYVSLPEYVGMRSLDAGNPYNYVAIVLQPRRGAPKDHVRIVLDTARVGNVLLGIEGPRDECFELIGKSKPEIKNSTLKTLQRRHDHVDNWHNVVRDWITGDN